MNQDAYAAHIGIDWSDRKHDIYLYDCTTGEAEERVISSQPDAIAAWVEGLRPYANMRISSSIPSILVLFPIIAKPFNHLVPNQIRLMLEF
jgi:hypothetical protein